tara:strand:- start:369 stop:776 length:408 start_codon:yes stop_codon:yes gene_type:complete
MPAKKKTTKKTAKKTAKKASASKPKKKEMNQAHGKVEKFEPTTLDQIWGDTGMTRYGHQNEEKYKQSLKEMTKSDIQAHAHFIGLVPVDNREQLEKRLVSEFRKYISGFVKPSATGNQTHPEISEEGLRILREGR